MRLTQTNLHRIIKEEIRAMRLSEGSYLGGGEYSQDENDLFIEYMKRVEGKISSEIFDLATALENMGLDSVPLTEKMDALREEFEGYYRIVSGETGY